MIGYKLLAKDMTSAALKILCNKDFQYSFNQRYHIEEGELELGECGFHFFSSIYEAILYKYILQKTYSEINFKSADLSIYEIDTLDGEIVADSITRDGMCIGVKASSVIYINREITNEEIDYYFKLGISNSLSYTIPFKHYKYEFTPSKIKEDVNPVGGSVQIPAIHSCEVIIKSKPEYKECIDKIDIKVVKDRLSNIKGFCEED